MIHYILHITPCFLAGHLAAGATPVSPMAPTVDATWSFHARSILWFKLDIFSVYILKLSNQWVRITNLRTRDGTRAWTTLASFHRKPKIPIFAFQFGVSFLQGSPYLGTEISPHIWSISPHIWSIWSQKRANMGWLTPYWSNMGWLFFPWCMAYHPILNSKFGVGNFLR